MASDSAKGCVHVKLHEPRDAASPARKRMLRRAFQMGGTDMRGRAAE